MNKLKRRIGVDSSEIFISQSGTGKVHLIAWEEQPFGRDFGYQSACGRYTTSSKQEVDPSFLSKFSESSICDQCQSSNVFEEEVGSLE